MAREHSSNPSTPDLIPILPVRSMVLFPGVVLPVSVGRAKSMRAIEHAVREQKPIGILTQRVSTVDDPVAADMYSVGTISEILRYVESKDGEHHAVCQGQQRFRIVEFTQTEPFFIARVARIEDQVTTSNELAARFLAVKNQSQEALELLPNTPPELATVVQGIQNPALLADMVSTFLDITSEEKQAVLETADVLKRIELVGQKLAHVLEVLKLSRDIRKQTTGSLSKAQREYYLREQLKTIQKELGEDESASVELEAVAKAIEAAQMPPEVEQEARKELRRLERMNESAAEYSMLRTWLDALVDLPWSKSTEDVIDIARAREILDEDHYGLAKVKRRIVEFLSVKKLMPNGKSPILCLVGPPGVGKTSLGQSIARAMGRKFVRISLGGVHDEGEIRGHRRTYIGALPGNIIQGMRKAGSNNPVFMLDELDKLNLGMHGDPSAALLEVLDPAQNDTFRDNYLGVPFDLSRAMFIGTANVLDAIPGPLRDRLEIIRLSGYTEEEKVQIARRYLIPRQREANGLTSAQCEISAEALREVVRAYTREAGVRHLEREIGSLFRSAATRIAEGTSELVKFDVADIVAVLGAPRFENDTAMRTSVPGVATGLAWTPVGGDILFIEATRMPGANHLTLTGQLGDVMRESALAAISLVKSRTSELGLDPAIFRDTDIHVHIPAGAIQKDGPSAGVTMYTALVSLLTSRTVKSDLAMTGEISLRGLVLPVGGIKEKVIAAFNAGIHTVLLPARNKRDYDEIPESVRRGLTFVWLETVDDAVQAALDPVAGSSAERALSADVGVAAHAAIGTVG
ncbi:MAG: endopeptidase La [Planctomycetota bacterium]